MTCPLSRCSDPKCDRLAFCLTESRVTQSRSIQVQKISDRQEKTDLTREFTGEYVGFNARSGKDLVRLPSGGVIACDSVSNGIAKVGSRISGVMPLGTGNGIVDRMPR